MSEQASNSEKVGNVDAEILETGELQNNEDETEEDSHDSFIILETTDEQVDDNKTLKEMANINADNLQSFEEDIDSCRVDSENMKKKIDSSFATTKDECVDKKVDEITDSIRADDLCAHSEQLISSVEEHTNIDKFYTQVDCCSLKSGDGLNKEAETLTEMAESSSGNNETPELSSTRNQALPEILQQENYLVDQEEIGERVDQTDLKHDQQATEGSDVKPAETAEDRTTGFQKHVEKTAIRTDTITNTDLLLIGKTGNGKSATGNNILRRRGFKSTGSTTSVTKIATTEVSEYKGRIIKVVDSPGVADTSENKEEAAKRVSEALECAMFANPSGFHAFILVLKYGGRFTFEDQETIAFLKKVFGEGFVRSYCILVLTGGDTFCSDFDDNDDSDDGENMNNLFENWCKEQTGVFQNLLMECCGRIILFDNTTKDKKKKCEQLDKLLKMVDNLRFGGHRYTDENFNKAKQTRERIMIESKIPIIKDQTMVETSLIIQKVQELQFQEDMEKKIKLLEDLMIRAENLHQSITSQDRGTGALHDLCETAKSVKSTVSEEIAFCNRMIRERERIKKQEEETRRMFEEKMRKQKEELEQRLNDERVAELERRNLEKEQEKSRRENEEKARKKLEEERNKLQKEIDENNKKYKSDTTKIEKQYEKAKEKNENTISRFCIIL